MKANHAKHHMAFSGIASFAMAPIEYDIQNIDADVAVLGIPFDEGTGFRPGTRFGPRGIRNMSVRFPFFGGKGYWDIQKKKKFLEGVSLVDCGDTDVLYMDIGYTFEQISSNVTSLLNTRALPVFIGGDHSVTFPIVKAFSCKGSINYIHLDAHLDYRDSVNGVRFAHGSPLRRISELSHVKECFAIGMRGLRHELDDYQAALKRGVKVITSADLREKGIKESLGLISGDRDYYISIDIDILDPALAPGTGTPETGGLNYTELREIFAQIAQRVNIIGFDLVEVNPMIDVADCTQLIGAQSIVEFIGEIFAAR
jgi:agmatinase